MTKKEIWENMCDACSNSNYTTRTKNGLKICNCSYFPKYTEDEKNYHPLYLEYRELRSQCSCKQKLFKEKTTRDREYPECPLIFPYKQ